MFPALTFMIQTFDKNPSDFEEIIFKSTGREELHCVELALHVRFAGVAEGDVAQKRDFAFTQR